MKVAVILFAIAAVLNAVYAQLPGYGVPFGAGGVGYPGPPMPGVYPPPMYPYPPSPPFYPGIGLNTAENANANSNTNVNAGGGGGLGRWF